MTGLGAAVGLAGCSLAMDGGGGGGAGGASTDCPDGRAGAAGATLDRSRPPDVGPPRSLALPEPRRLELRNGIPVLLIERHDLPVVEVRLQFPGGAGSLDARTAGLATLVADMLDEGTGSRSALEIAEEVERLGASLQTGASWDVSMVELSVLEPRLGPALDLLADVVTDPAFDAGELERVRQERLGRILQSMDEPRVLADLAFGRILYGPDHPYGVPLLGTRESLEALDRDRVAGFYRAHYRPENARIVVAGAVTEDEVREALELRFGTWEGTRGAARRADAGGASEAAAPRAAPLPGATDAGAGRAPDVAAAPAPADSGVTIHLVDRPGAPQSEIRVGRVGVARTTEDYYPITVLNTVLGGSFTSRLNRILREERGYTYGAYSSFAMRRSAGPFVAQAAVNTPATDSAVAIFLRELERIGAEAVPTEELERARRYVALRLPQRFETVSDAADRAAELVLHGLPLDFYDTFVERTLAVIEEDVAAAARRYLPPDGLLVVVAGDAERIEEPLRALGVGPVVRLPAEGGGR